MKVKAIAAEIMDLANDWWADACRYQSVSRKIECFEAAIPLYESAEQAGFAGGQERADACRRNVAVLKQFQ
jgi:hypothetical protein